MTLVEFIEARLAEDEAAARAACRPRPDFGSPDRWEPGVGLPAEVMGPMESVAGTKSPAAAAHIARHDPARVLREVEAHRRMVEELWLVRDSLPVELALCALASVYAEHPDFREEWRP
jgi:hypothetical protein